MPSLTGTLFRSQHADRIISTLKNLFGKKGSQTAPYRSAIVGCGKIGSLFADDPLIHGIYSHAEAYMACAETTLVGVCDVDPQKLERCGDRWSVPGRYLDVALMLAELQPEILSVCTPDNTHYNIILKAINSPGMKAVLAEKPLAMSLREARHLVHLAEQRGVVLSVNYSRRYNDSINYLRDLLKSGELGAVQTVGGIYTKGMFHNGTHWIDLARFMIGEVSRVSGFDLLREDSEDPTLDAVFEFEHGASGHIQGCDARAYTIFEMDVLCTEGRIRIVESGFKSEIYHVVASPRVTGYRDLALKYRQDHGIDNVLLNLLEDVVECMTSNIAPRCSGADGMAAIEIASAVRDSVESGCAVSVETQS